MKHSLRIKITAAFIGLFTLATVVVLLINHFWLPQYYVKVKMQTLKTCMDKLETAKDASQFTDSLARYCGVNNLSLAVTDERLSPLYTVTSGSEGKTLPGKIFGYYSGEDSGQKEILESTDRYVIQQTADMFTQIPYMEIWGQLENKNYFIIRTPLESIQESAAISNRFYVYVGLGMALVGAVFAWFLTRRLTRPLTELTALSQRMAALDFDTKYTSGGKDEIGVLGHNFNTMSQQLEQTISELKTANNELQRDIRRKTEIDEMRKEFLSNVSHELKTPIALIQGYAEGLQDNITEDAQSRQFYCEVIVDEANKMNRLVQKLLTLNQLEFGQDQVVMERFDLASVIRGIVESSKILIQQKEAKIQLELEESIPVWGDEFKVEQVLTNYLTNGLNHLEGERILKISCTHDRGRVRISVFNTGQPIPQEDLEKIWVKFYKVDKARTREYGGSGIGLSIVKAIMDSMNQEYGVINRENGVEFWFTLEEKGSTDREEEQ